MHCTLLQRNAPKPMQCDAPQTLTAHTCTMAQRLKKPVFEQLIFLLNTSPYVWCCCVTLGEANGQLTYAAQPTDLS